MAVLDYIPQIAAAGAMGVSILCILRVAALLKKEQERDDPRPAFLRSIYVFMGFGLIMTLVSLGIELSRFSMTAETGELATLSKELKRIESQGFYSLNQNGNPVDIFVEVGPDSILLTRQYPEGFFSKTALDLIADETVEDRYRAVKDNNGTLITYGYFTEETLTSRLRGLLPADPSVPPTTTEPTGHSLAHVENLYAAGRSYSPPTLLRNLKLKDLSDIEKANNRLIDFLNKRGGETAGIQKEAVKILIQSDMLQELSKDGHDKLIEILSDNTVRKLPWRLFELAQVYKSRYDNWNAAPEDLERYKNFSRQYITLFEDKGLNAVDDAPEYRYYRTAAEKALGYTLACSTCLIGETKPTDK